MGHAQWVFTVPKLLRPYFMHHSQLLGPLCTAAWETARELMAEPAGGERGFRPGMVAVVQTFGDQLNLHPHVHALVTRGGSSPALAALRRRWAQLIRRVYRVDPLVCPRCRGVMRVVSLITQPRLIRRILDHLAGRATQERVPPAAPGAVLVIP